VTSRPRSDCHDALWQVGKTCCCSSFPLTFFGKLQLRGVSHSTTPLESPVEGASSQHGHNDRAAAKAKAGKVANQTSEQYMGQAAPRDTRDDDRDGRGGKTATTSRTRAHAGEGEQWQERALQAEALVVSLNVELRYAHTYVSMHECVRVCVLVSFLGTSLG